MILPDSTSTPTPAGPQFLILARVLRPHGVRGDVRVQVVTRFPERMISLDVIYVGRDPTDPASLRQHHVTRAHHDKDNLWLLHFEGVNDREAADRFRAQYLCVALEDAVPLADDEVYLFQVIGLEVRTTDGMVLGNVADVLETGANDVYIVKGETYGEVLIPAIQGVIQDINVESGLMIVQLPAGLLPDE